tara:strand:+ start:260 stop:625 length:366 start_codon:yes stop_codon:yes gene_type:complete
LTIGWISVDFQAATVPYISIEDLTCNFDSFKQKRFRLGGIVQNESINYSNDKLTVNFILKQGDYSLSVKHKSAAIPDLFGNNAEVIIEGSYDKSMFIADNLMTKCASRYEEEQEYYNINNK